LHSLSHVNIFVLLVTFVKKKTVIVLLHYIVWNNANTNSFTTANYRAYLFSLNVKTKKTYFLIWYSGANYFSINVSLCFIFCIFIYKVFRLLNESNGRGITPKILYFTPQIIIYNRVIADYIQLMNKKKLLIKYNYLMYFIHRHIFKPTYCTTIKNVVTKIWGYL
jgi:hypothetical protein